MAGLPVANHEDGLSVSVKVTMPALYHVRFRPRLIYDQCVIRDTRRPGDRLAAEGALERNLL
jgi:hypothetical protein